MTGCIDMGKTAGVGQSSQRAHCFRRDIEGLRALAVISVILNHTQATLLKGGFAGVDVFFVISGFLIGKHLLEDIENRRFSWLGFYARRARRLLPALIAMLLGVWCMGWLVLSGPEFVDLGKHIVAASFFSNNVLLAFQSGYFDAPAVTKPLLHLWSLGVEEQFYLLVPVLLWLGSTGNRASIRWVLRLSALSFLLTVMYAEPSFYLLDTRFWELGAGVTAAYLTLEAPPPFRENVSCAFERNKEFIIFLVLCALAVALAYAFNGNAWNWLTIAAGGGLLIMAVAAIPAVMGLAACGRDVWNRLFGSWQHREKGLCRAASAAGLVLLLISLSEVDSTGWPGLQTVLPVLGTFLVILAGPVAPGNRILAWQPMVLIGGISYPLYLWHWPAIVFWRMLDFDRSPVGLAVPVAAAFVLALFTKTFVEKPFRVGASSGVKRPTWKLPIAVMALVMAGFVGASTVATGGYPIRIPIKLREVANWAPSKRDVDDWSTNVCLFRPGFTGEFDARCMPAKQPGRTQILLLGDSHAAHLYPGLISLHGSFDFVLAQWTANGCPPILEPFAGEPDYCAGRRARALKDISRVAPDTVLVSGAWEKYLSQGNPEKTVVAATEQEILWLKDSGIRHIVLFGPERSWITSESADLFRYMLRKRLEHIPERIGQVSAAVRRLDSAMAAEAAREHVDYVSVIDRFCDPTGCLIAGDPRMVPPDFLFRDQDHLTAAGSKFLVDGASSKIFGVVNAK